MKILGTKSARSAERRRVQGVVRVSSTTREIETATRTMMIAAPCSPSDVSPTSWPKQVPRGTTIVPGVIRLSVAGSTTMPVKIGMKSQTRLTKNTSDSPVTTPSARTAA